MADIETGWDGMFEMPEPVPRSPVVDGDEPTCVVVTENGAAPSAVHSKPRVKELYEAIRMADLNEVKKLRAEGVSFGCYVEDDGVITTPLQYCVKAYARYWRISYNDETNAIRKKGRQDEVEIMNELLAAAVENSGLNLKNRNGESPLLTAIKAGDLMIVDALMSAGARTQGIGEDGQSALHASTLHHHILNYFLDYFYIKLSDDEQKSVIHYASKYGELTSMKILIKRCLRSRLVDAINSVDKDGLTPLYYSAKRGHVDMTALLFLNSATLSFKKKGKTVVEVITTQFANSVTFFEHVFDDCIKMAADEVSIDYSLMGISQIQVMDDLVKYKQSKLLKHPLIESLIYLKWKCLLPMYMTIMGIENLL